MRLLYVSCQIPEGRIYELLRLLEATKVGNVEVRPVVPVVEQAIKKETKVNGLDKRGRPPVTAMVSDKMVVGKEWRLRTLSRALGVRPTSVHTAMTALIRRGEVVRKSPGIYARVKEGN